MGGYTKIEWTDRSFYFWAARWLILCLTNPTNRAVLNEIVGQSDTRTAVV